jgi:hypothetical protein
MAIAPDNKNWTWVLERTCPECGFDASTFDAFTSPEAILNNTQEWIVILNHVHVRQRPRENVWSALEYGCHVRDVFRLYAVRLRLMVELDNPTFENWDQDETAIAESYGHQDPAVVSRELVEAGHKLAHDFATVTADHWARSGMRSDGARFTIETFAKYMIHDPIHHVYDARQGFLHLASAEEWA